ncbi:ATP-binding cassette domain-containing protein [Actinomadura rudentiformis]|uniref:ATP-binding cassette domain-containing protein n=1 Tax=Actinomadura rudentiformis TaxID=359158 RepID=UPI001CEF7089|nr:ATP-binding cassette domain-containing protein [Actinomadura rudentiformis]
MDGTVNLIERPTAATIETHGLRKHYGRTLAVNDLTFTVVPGRVTGFVGPNGAGKSTTMRMILGLDTPDEGRALVGGRPYRGLRTPLRHVGALLDANALHPARRACDHLLWMAHSNGIPARRVDEVLDQVGLATVARRRAGAFSLGMKQRLGIAAALLGDAPVLMFDEPVNGLDPEGIRWICGLLRGLAAQGRAVLVSSHLMSELEDTADHLIVIGRGRLLADTSVRDLRAQASGGRAQASGGRAQASGERAQAPGAQTQASGERHGLEQISLEEAYLRLTRDATEYTATEDGT